MTINWEIEQEDPPLWWDEVSYIGYQSYDPYANDDPDAWMRLSTGYSADYCPGGSRHREDCPKGYRPGPDDPPF